jgi:hypothetical protein
MPSPFPGMNPYLEHPNVWHDFHGILVTLMRLDLAEQLRNRYQVRMDDNVYIHEIETDERNLVGRPDVFVTSKSAATKTDAAASAALLEAPVRGEVPIVVDVLREHFIEIRDRDERRLVTVIELLSPSNKDVGEDRSVYLGKRRKYLRTDVNLVEIDLLRRGRRVPVRNLPRCDYCIVITPGSERPNAGMWPLSIRDRLPNFPVPLLPQDEAARIDLQSMVETAYDRGAYSSDLFLRPLDPPLPPEDDTWATEILRSAGFVRTDQNR